MTEGKCPRRYVSIGVNAWGVCDQEGKCPGGTGYWPATEIIYEQIIFKIALEIGHSSIFHQKYGD